MRLNRCVLIIIVLAYLAQLSHSLATSVSLDPFEGLAGATVGVMIGDGLDVTGRDGVRLFAGNGDREAAFVTRLENSISDRLSKSGIKTTDDGEAEISVSIWGHEIPGEASDLSWVFYFDLSVYRSDWDPLCPDDSGKQAGKLGATSDTELEVVMHRAVMVLLDDWLHRRDVSRERQAHQE